jgi:hypothetical protein
MKVTPERVVRNKLSTFLLKQFIYSKITMTTSDLYSQSRETDNIGHKKQNGDKQNKNITKNTKKILGAT